jgi:hypothetical protein
MRRQKLFDLALPREVGEASKIKKVGNCLGKNGPIDFQGFSRESPKQNQAHASLPRAGGTKLDPLCPQCFEAQLGCAAPASVASCASRSRPPANAFGPGSFCRARRASLVPASHSCTAANGAFVRSPRRREQVALPALQPRALLRS